MTGTLIAHLRPPSGLYSIIRSRHIYITCQNPSSACTFPKTTRSSSMPLQEPPSYITLPSGDRMPSLGLGCWQSPPSELSSAVNHALKSGYRHIDGATIYGNEHAMGEGIRQSGIPREDIWVTTKLWNCRSSPLCVTVLMK